jgi:LCP family protein required for cell wall assembly
MNMNPKHKASTDNLSEDTRPNYVIETWDKPQPSQRQRGVRKVLRSGCLVLLGILVAILFVSLVYFLVPFRTNLLVIGIDRTPDGSDLGRSDTNILVTVKPLGPYIGLLSIPRDLWVAIPGVGENRINTAHFFAEGQNPGSGPAAALETIQMNFGVPVKYFVRVKFDGIVGIVDALDGIDIELDSPMAGLPAGNHHLTGEQSLVFVRDRQGSDDFFRMQQGQFLISELIEQSLQPISWPRIPAVIKALNQSIDTNIPVWVWPRLAFALLRAGPGGIDSYILNRDYVSSSITSEGAQVLIPQWSLIIPLVNEIFGD